MAFLQKLFSRTPKAPLPELVDLLEARGLDRELPGLDKLLPDFEHLNDAAEREDWADAIASLMKSGHELPEPWLDSMDRLLPELIPAWQAEREGCFNRPVAEGLCHRIRVGERVVRPQDLRLWQVDAQEVLERTVDHLRERSKEAGFERQPSGIYRSAYGDGMDAARLLLPDLWSKTFPGQNLFVTVPSQGVLLVSPQVLLPKLVEATQQVLGAAHGPRLLGVMYQWVHDTLIPANLQDPHPMAQSQRELRQMDFLAALAAQEADLDPAAGAPAQVGIMSTKEGRTQTVATWPAGRPVLLPETDLIAFMGPGQEPLGVFWRQHLPRIFELKGTPIPIWGPRRVRFEGFPTSEQLERMEVFATADQMRALRPQGPQAPPRPAPTSPSPAASMGAARPTHLAGLNLGVQDDGA